MDKRQARELRSPKIGICDSSVASIVRGPSMKAGYTQFLITDDIIMVLEGDVTAVYKTM